MNNNSDCAIWWQVAWCIGFASGIDDDASGPIDGEGKTVEADETFVIKQRGRANWEFTNDRAWITLAGRLSIPRPDPIRAYVVI
jgi:hypothetical protein